MAWLYYSMMEFKLYIFFNQCEKRLMLILMNSSSKLNLLSSMGSLSSKNLFSGDKEHCNSISSRA